MLSQMCFLPYYVSPFITGCFQLPLLLFILNGGGRRTSVFYLKIFKKDWEYEVY